MDTGFDQLELKQLLRQFNPWWQGGPGIALPHWQRTAFAQLVVWAKQPTGRALVIVGARQVGKTTLLLQTIRHLLDQGVPAPNILYATFDHPLVKLAGLEQTIAAWREIEPLKEGPAYLFLDEIQAAPDWQVWIKHQADFQPQYRIALTGSASPLTLDGQESGVGRWTTLQLPTASFYEFLQLRNADVGEIEVPESLEEVFHWPEPKRGRTTQATQALIPHFHDYLVRGGFPECISIEEIAQLQRTLREDIIDKVLKRDMTAFYGVRNVLEMEQLFLYLCIQNGGEVSATALSRELKVTKKAIQSHLNLLVATHLLYSLRSFGYGKEVLRGRSKYYLADTAIAPSVLLKGRDFLDDQTALGKAVEAAVYKHLHPISLEGGAKLSFWRNNKGKEVDIVAEYPDRAVPIEVKYRNRIQFKRDLEGIRAFAEGRGVDRGYLLTKRPEDFGVADVKGGATGSRVLQLPAALACYWLGAGVKQL